MEFDWTAAIANVLSLFVGSFVGAFTAVYVAVYIQPVLEKRRDDQAMIEQLKELEKAIKSRNEHLSSR